MEHILIVEDDLNLQETLLDIFELKGFQVSSADNGKEAIEAIEYEKPTRIQGPTVHNPTQVLRLPKSLGWASEILIAARKWI